MNEAQDSVAGAAMVAVPEDRMGAAREAIWQIDAMLAMLYREHQQEGECFDLALSACMPRLRALASVVMSVVAGDDGRTTEEMREVVHG